MRIDLKKFLFYGSKTSLESFFNKAQDVGLVEFIDKKPSLKNVPENIQILIAAIKILRTQPTLAQEELSYKEASALAEKIVLLKKEIDQLEKKKKEISIEYQKIKPFGQFSLLEIKTIEKESKRQIQFFFTKRGRTAPEELIFIQSQGDFDYYLAINEEKKSYEHFLEEVFNKDLDTTKNQLNETKQKIDQNHQELKSLSKYNQFLHHALIYYSNDYHLEQAKNAASSLLEESLFAIEGWVPKNRSLQKLLDETDIQAEEISIDPDDKIPTLLENKGIDKVGEDLVTFYDTPSKGDLDPSLWVLFFFSLFFAIIVGDGGYGLVFLVAALVIRYKNPKMESSAKRFWKLFLLLCFSTIAWGFLTHSFFGISFSENSIFKKIAPLHWLTEKKAEYHFKMKDSLYQEWINKVPTLKEATNSQEFINGADKMRGVFTDSVLIEVALLVGTIHICLSLMRYIRRNPTGWGWLLAIIGGYLYFPMLINGTSMIHYALGFNKEILAEIGLYMMLSGISLAIIIAIIQRGFMGILELTALTAIFADILSYLRLYALGLSGSVVTGTINEIASSLNMTFLAILLLIVGHGINMVLSVVGGVIHGLRLNFIEWYHYSYEGGGKLFNPLRKN